MPSRNTVIRSLHDLGAAAWFGGSLMGAVGLNGAADAVRDPQDRARVASLGWAKWAPVNAAAISVLTSSAAGHCCMRTGTERNTRAGSKRTRSPRSLSRALPLRRPHTAVSSEPRSPQQTANTSRVLPNRRPRPPTRSPPLSGKLQYVQWALPALTGAHRRSGSAAGRAATPRTNSHRARFHSGPSCPQVNPHCFPEQTRLMMQNSDSSTITVEDARLLRGGQVIGVDGDVIGVIGSLLLDPITASPHWVTVDFDDAGYALVPLTGAYRDGQSLRVPVHRRPGQRCTGAGTCRCSNS